MEGNKKKTLEKTRMKDIIEKIDIILLLETEKYEKIIAQMIDDIFHEEKAEKYLSDAGKAKNELARKILGSPGIIFQALHKKLREPTVKNFVKKLLSKWGKSKEAHVFIDKVSKRVLADIYI